MAGQWLTVRVLRNLSLRNRLGAGGSAQLIVYVTRRSGERRLL